MTWDRRLYFPSEGSRATDFYRLESVSSSAGSEPASLGSSSKYDSHLTTDWKKDPQNGGTRRKVN
jgi:hypothetical protein